jgi:hypothetical protein
MPSTKPTASSQPTNRPSATPPILNRYTTLPSLLDILHKKHITLLSPDTWEDRNDAYYLERYQLESKFRSVLPSVSHCIERPSTIGAFFRAAPPASALSLTKTSDCGVLRAKMDFGIRP